MGLLQRNRFEHIRLPSVRVCGGSSVHTRTLLLLLCSLAGLWNFVTALIQGTWLWQRSCFALDTLSGMGEGGGGGGEGGHTEPTINLLLSFCEYSVCSSTS